MGNTPSTSKEKQQQHQHQAAGSSSTSHSPSHALQKQTSPSEIPTRRSPRRRESIHTLSHAKATPAPPSASLASATAQPLSATTSPSQSRAIPPASTSTSRTRSSTATTPRLHPHDPSPIDIKMGSESSRPQRPTSRTRTLQTPPPPPSIKTSPASRPVDVPSARNEQHSFQPSPLDPSAPPSEAYNLPPANFSRPPRLPLPIEEEDHIPGSPILSSADITSPVDGDETIIRRASIISSTVDDEEEPDDQGYMADAAAGVKKVPTVIEWRDAAPTDRVYVTGTFTDWQRKFRLHHNGPSKHKNTLSALIQLPPGTHHVKFIANGDMLCSDHLPTTVDYTNILVNYVEVSPDDLPAAGKNTAPVLVPSKTQPPVPARPLDIRPKPSDGTAAAVSRTTSHQQHAPPAATSSPRSRPVSSARARSPPPPTRASPSPSAKPKQPAKEYTGDIPSYLLDLDTWPPPTDSPRASSPSSSASRYHRANAAATVHPVPPSLPMFLSKSILNGTTPIKDDSSVLIMPNHTVLNHLATTNIKQGVLATSATTRYKRKFLTTIMYKPRSDDGD